MSHAEQTDLENSIGAAVSHNVRPFLLWIRSMVIATVGGTAAVVHFVYNTNSAIEKCSTIIAQHEKELDDKSLEDKARDKAISRMEGRLGLVSAKGLPEPKEAEEN